MNHQTSPIRGSSEIPEDLLPVTISLLLTAIDKFFPNRGCSEVSLAFECERGEPRIRVSAITDSEGCIILEQRRILDWQPESSPRIGDLLETAAELHLDEHFPEWCDGSGSNGMLLFAIRQEPGGALGVHPRGIAWTQSPVTRSSSSAG